MTPEQRRRDRGRRRAAPRFEPLAPLMPGLLHGGSLSFWEDELRLDCAQEASLAALEGRDPAEAVKAYRQRELAWRRVTCPLPAEGIAA